MTCTDCCYEAFTSYLKDGSPKNDKSGITYPHVAPKLYDFLYNVYTYVCIFLYNEIKGNIV